MTDFLSQDHRTQLIMESNFLNQQNRNQEIDQNHQAQQKNFSELNKLSLLPEESKSPSIKKEHKMTEQEKEENRKILKNMNRKLNYTKNPRFRNQNKCLLYSNSLFQEIMNKENPFVVEPMIVIFREYQLNCVYQLDLKLTNRKQILTSFKYIPPLTENFSVKRIIYPKKDSSLIAPGMHAKLEILFNATTLDWMEDEISIITEFFAFKVPLRAIREKPCLSLENPMNCGKCLIGDQTSMVFRCRNIGGDAHFKFIVNEFDNGDYISENNKEKLNNNSIYGGTNYTIDNEVLVTGPFSIFPQEFYLYKGMSVEVYVNFNPKTEGLIEKNMFICCDSKDNISHQIFGEGIRVDFKIIAIDDLIADETFEKLENIFFEDAYPSTNIYRNLKIKNLSKYQLKYHWNIYDLYEANKNFIDDKQNYFSISPENGFFEPLQELTFIINFNPQNCKNYEQKLDLIIEDVPFQAIKNFKFNNFDNFNKNNNIKLAKNTFTKGEPFMLALNSPYPSYPIFSFNLVGKGKECELDVDSKIIDLGKVFIGEKINKRFNLYNFKSGVLKFKFSNIIQGMKDTLLENSQFGDFNKALFNDIMNYSKIKYKFNNKNSTLTTIGREDYNNNKTNENFNHLGFDNSKLVNIYFKVPHHGMSFTDHFRDESIFKLKNPMEISLNEIFERFKKEREQFKDKDDDFIMDVNKSIFISEDVETKINNNNNNFLKNTSISNMEYFKNTKSEIDNNFLNYSKLKNCKFLKLLTSKDNFTNKVIMRENSKSQKRIPTTKMSFKNSTGNYLNKSIRIKESINSNNNQNDIMNTNNKVNSIIIRRPESNLTCISTKYDANKSKLNLKQSIPNKVLDPISESINEKPNNKKSPYLLNKPVTKSLQLKGVPLNRSNTLASIQTKETNDINRSSKKGFLKPLNPTMQSQQNQLDLINKIQIGTNLSRLTNSLTLKIGQSMASEDQNFDEVEIQENDELSINKDQKVSINITFQPCKLGLFKCSCIIKAEDGIPFSVDLTANVVGPQIISDIPAIDFGLFSINEIKTIKFKLINNSLTCAKYLIKENRFKNINFDNYLESEYLNDLQGVIIDKKPKKKIEDLIDFENEHMRAMDIYTIDNYEIKFSPICGIIREKSEVEITASFISAYPKYLNDVIEVMVQHSESLFISIHADCQEAFAYIDKVLINPVNIFVTVPISFENNLIRIVNPSNLPVNFEWENIHSPDEKIIQFYPRKGLIKPRSYVEISYKMIYYMIKPLDDIYTCKIEQMDVPLGVNVNGLISGLDIVYEYTDETFNFLLGKLETASMHSSITTTSLIRKNLTQRSNIRSLNPNSLRFDKSLKIIDLKNLKVNKHFNFQFIIKNNSGISTYFSLTSKNYSPGIDKDLKYEIQANKPQLNSQYDNYYSNSKSNIIIEHGQSPRSINSIDNIQNSSKANSFNGSLNLNGNKKNLERRDSNNMSVNKSTNFVNKRYDSIRSNPIENEVNNNNSTINLNRNNSSVNPLNSSTLKPIKTLNSLRHSQNSEKNIFHHLKKKDPETIGHQLLNDQHENLIFTSPKGIEHTKMKQIEKESHMYLSNKKGVALVIEPSNGKLEPYSEILVSISIYNECVGDFEDELVSQIKGLAERRFPIQLKIRGNPLQLAPFQTGIDYNEEPPLLKIGNVITKINQINKTFKVINTGGNLIMLKWKIYDFEKILNPSKNRDLVRLRISESKGLFSLKFIPNEPEESTGDEKTYDIQPNNYLMQPKETKEFDVSFRTNEPGLKSSLLVAFPKFMDNNSISNVGLNELAVKIDANGIFPKLLVDKTLHFTGKYIYRLYLHSFGMSPKPKKSIVLINKEKINFIIKLIVEGPFKITKTEPIESTIGNSLYNISQKQNLKVEIKAITPDHKNYQEWPVNLVNEKHGKLICVFENGEIQEYYLTTVLKRPRISISITGNDAIESDKIIDFGSVNCESFKKSELFIKNETDVYSDWSINYHKFVPNKYYGYGTTTESEREDLEMNDDPDVFLFSITSGVIPGPSLPLINIPLGPCLPKVDNYERDKLLPIKVEIMFKPKKNIPYKCRYKIITSTGNNIEFNLKGYGSYNEEEIL